MTTLRRQQITTAAAAPTTQDTRNLLALACALRDRARHLLARPDALRARARQQLAELPEQQIHDHLGVLPTELLATLSALRRALDITAALRPRIDPLLDEIEELVALARRAAHPLRMFCCPRHRRDAAQVGATQLRRFVLALSTLRLADEIRRRCAELDAWHLDAPSLWLDYEVHAVGYELLLADLVHDQEQPEAQ